MNSDNILDMAELWAEMDTLFKKINDENGTNRKSNKRLLELLNKAIRFMKNNKDVVFMNFVSGNGISLEFLIKQRTILNKIV